uniref:C-type lectin domain-containing protein n=1 Tax=Poecilia mexicana TaxID=48701 RepID=A0A3B3WBP6_9TELE
MILKLSISIALQCDLNVLLLRLVWVVNVQTEVRLQSGFISSRNNIAKKTEKIRFKPKIQPILQDRTRSHSASWVVTTEGPSCSPEITGTSVTLLFSCVTEEPCLKCEAGWELHGGNCYKFSSSKSSWTDGRCSCTDLGSDLVKIDSREEQVGNSAADMFWIGLSDSDNDGGWFWVDGSPMNTRNGEPRDESGEPAADSGGNGEQDGASDLKCSLDKSCDLLHRSVCEKAAAPGRIILVKNLFISETPSTINTLD